MSYKRFLEFEKKYRENKPKRIEALDKKNWDVLSILPTISFHLTVDESYGIHFSWMSGMLLFDLDEEDIEYFRKKCCSLLEKERKERIDEINKGYDSVKGDVNG